MINRRQPWRGVLQSVAIGLVLTSYCMARPAACRETNVVLIIGDWEGRRATWPKIERIRNTTQISRTFDDCLRSMSERYRYVKR